MAKPRVAFKTVGCRLNKAETAQMTAQFEHAGYSVVPFGSDCDVAVVHGCTVTNEAERKTAKYTRSARKCSPDATVILAGCPAQVRGDDLLRSSGASMLADQHEKFRLPQLIAGTEAASTQDVIPPLFDTTRAPVKVQDGCDFRCSYCVVPATRGTPVSRPLPEVIAELSSLADAGYREVVLSGANLACYTHDGNGLLELLRAVDRVDGLQRIRLSSLEITAQHRDIVDFMAQSDKVCRFLHVPMQSGDDRILAAMGRRYDSAKYRETIEYAVEKIGMLGLGTDIIVGYPGEDDQAFSNTRQLVEDLPFSNLHVFPYSPRPHTRAADLTDEVPMSVKRERSRVLHELGHQKRLAFAQRLREIEVAVLIEKLESPTTGTGWTGEYMPAVVTGSHLEPNQIVTAAPSRIDGETLHIEANSA